MPLKSLLWHDVAPTLVIGHASDQDDQDDQDAADQDDRGDRTRVKPGPGSSPEEALITETYQPITSTPPYRGGIDKCFGENYHNLSQFIKSQGETYRNLST
jgi:hypothetical protein